MIKPVQLAIIFDQNMRFGGGYQQALNAAIVAKLLPPDLVSVSFFTTFKENVENLSTQGISTKFIDYNLIRRVKSYIRRQVEHPRLLSIIKFFERNNYFEGFLMDHNIDLVYFVSPSSLAGDLEELNYITTVWDLCHRDNPEFPEVRSNRQYEIRERNYKSILPRAMAVLVDSDLGKKNLIQRYAIEDDRIFVMPFEGSISTRLNDVFKISSTSVNEKYNLKVPYVFYPAQFWAHKNHIYILRGLKELELKHNLLIGAIFSGSDMGNLEYIKNCATELGLDDRIRFVGFVSEDDIVELYIGSIALVMPTYFGPTNMPPLEAFTLGVPVLYSDKRGMREQVGNAALLMNLTDPISMADHLARLIQSAEVRNNLIIRGKERLDYLNKVQRVDILTSILEEYRCKRVCWS